MYYKKIVEAIVEFRESNGTQWKRKLRELFFGVGNRCEYLQRFRNNYYDVLDKIKGHSTKEEIEEILKQYDSRK